MPSNFYALNTYSSYLYYTGRKSKCKQTKRLLSKMLAARTAFNVIATCNVKVCELGDSFIVEFEPFGPGSLARTNS